VAGRFYDEDPEMLERHVQALLPVGAARSSAIGAIVPHAGYIYSGPVAGAVYARLLLPRPVVILCPNHTGRGAPAALDPSAAWRTPLGDVPLARRLADRLLELAASVEEDSEAHRREHSLEVQLPFLQALAGGFTFVPLCLATHDYALCEEIGSAIADVVRGQDIGILASSDLNHYEDQQTTLRKDQLAIDEVVGLDPRSLWQTVDEHDVSMCGFIPTTVMLVAAKKLGATRARLLKHATSGDINGDYGHVVGYASVLIS